MNDKNTFIYIMNFFRKYPKTTLSTIGIVGLTSATRSGYLGTYIYNLSSEDEQVYISTSEHMLYSRVDVEKKSEYVIYYSVNPVKVYQDDKLVHQTY